MRGGTNLKSKGTCPSFAEAESPDCLYTGWTGSWEVWTLARETPGAHSGWSGTAGPLRLWNIEKVNLGQSWVSISLALVSKTTQLTAHQFEVSF